MSAAHSDDEAVVIDLDANGKAQGGGLKDAQGTTTDGEAEIEEDGTWTAGNFEIISSDRVRFKVQSYFLYASSSVFRDAHSLDKGEERLIALTDGYCETASTMRAFLHLVVYGRISKDVKLPGLKELVAFLDKWGCEIPLGHLCALLEIAIRRDVVNGFAAFDVAAHASNVDLCHLILKTQEGRCWPELEEGLAPNLLDGSPGETIWNPCHWPSWVFETGPPPTHLFALARAYGSKGDSPLADEFMKHLRVVEKAIADKFSSERPEDSTLDDSWTQGDIEIRSTDNVRFLIDKFYLQANSPRFREEDRSKSRDLRAIELSATATVVRLFLQLVSKGYLQVDEPWTGWKELAQLLVDWKCEQPLKAFCFLLENRLRAGRIGYSLSAFLAAAAAEDGDTHLKALVELSVRRRTVFGEEAFIVAAQADDVELYGLILVQEEKYSWLKLKDR
ncbi:hypothetical protein CspHIS471_0600400 [Cutaneotrichosporon sp. HIS471]|nr:hypothetical protein CspHIS471_0600400 [Cutaneotrichosporon sp. HIS471]